MFDASVNGADRRQAMEEFMADANPEAIFLDGLDDAIVGWVEQHTKPTLVAYDLDRILAALRKQGMTEDEAVEYFDFNIGCLWAGQGTPAILSAPVM